MTLKGQSRDENPEITKLQVNRTCANGLDVSHMSIYRREKCNGVPCSIVTPKVVTRKLLCSFETLFGRKVWEFISHKMKEIIHIRFNQTSETSVKLKKKTFFLVQSDLAYVKSDLTIN